MSFALGGGETVMVISGPNTGGKTVCLKTTGLAALSAQSGIPVAAERAEMPVFDRVLADIGDEQSIAADLSTFSAHMLNLKSMLDVATDRSLDSRGRNGHRHGAGRRRGARGCAARGISCAPRADARDDASRPAESLRLDDAGNRRTRRWNSTKRICGRPTGFSSACPGRRAESKSRGGWDFPRAWWIMRARAFRPNRARRAI